MRNSVLDVTLGSQGAQIEYNLTIGDPSFSVSQAADILIPINILTGSSSLEAIVVYLKENLELSFIAISKLLNRDQRTIWATYSKAKKKATKTQMGDDAGVMAMPLSIFRSRKLSILESIVFYLKGEHDLSFNEIAKMLGKNYRTIWTVYNRAIVKVEKDA